MIPLATGTYLWVEPELLFWLSSRTPGDVKRPNII